MAFLGNGKSHIILSSNIIPLCDTEGVSWRCVFVGTCIDSVQSSVSVHTFINSFFSKRSKFFIQPEKRPYCNHQL